MNLQEFKSTIYNRGVAKTSHFTVYMTPPQKIISNLDDEVARNLSFRINTVEIPGRQIQQTPLRDFGPFRQIGFEVFYTPVTIQVLLSADLSEKIFFQQWQDMIIGNHRTGEISGKRFNVGYYSDYISTVDIYQYDETGKQTYYCKLLEAYPVFVGQLQGTWQGEEAHMLNVQMQYRFFNDDTANLQFGETRDRERFSFNIFKDVLLFR